MSLDSQIAELSSIASSLIETFNNKDASIEARILQALQTIPKMDLKFHVDQINGSDSNPGTFSSPISSLKEAFRRTPFGGRTIILLLGDYQMNELVEATGISVLIRPYDTGVSPKVKFTFLAKEVNGIANTNGIYSSDRLSIHFQHVHLVLPDLSAIGGAVGNDACCIGPRYSSHGAMLEAKFTYCEYTVPSTTSFLFAQTSCFTFIQVGSTTIPSSLAGKWINNVSAGTLVDDLTYILAKGVTSL